MTTIDPARLVKLGNYANDGTGDDLRTAFTKVNSVVEELWSEANISTAVNVGSGVGIFLAKDGINLKFKTLLAGNYANSLGPSIVLTENISTITIAAVTKLQTDTNPKIVAPVFNSGSSVSNNPLNLNGNQLVNGDVQTTVWGYDIQLLNATIALMLENRTSTIDMGTFNEPTGRQSPTNLPKGYNIDMGIWTFGDPAPQNQLNFGTFA